MTYWTQSSSYQCHSSLACLLSPPSSSLLSVISSSLHFLFHWVIVLLLLYLIISLPNPLRWKSPRHQIPAVTSATESVQTNSCCQYQFTIVVSGQFIPSLVLSCLSGQKSIYKRRPQRDATPLLISKYDIFWFARKTCGFRKFNTNNLNLNNCKSTRINPDQLRNEQQDSCEAVILDIFTAMSERSMSEASCCLTAEHASMLGHQSKSLYLTHN